MYYTKVYNEFVGAISALFRQQARQLLSKKCRNGGETLATLCPIWLARGFNRSPPAS